MKLLPPAAIAKLTHWKCVLSVYKLLLKYTLTIPLCIYKYSLQILSELMFTYL